MVMNNFISYIIKGNKLSSAGFQPIISTGDDIEVGDRTDVILGALPYYYTFTHSESHSIFIMRRFDVTSYMGARAGRMAIAVAIPKGWRMANAKSPFDLLNELWAAYRDRYMEWGEFSQTYQFQNVTEDESIFRAIIANYPLEIFSGVTPVTMRGISAAWLQASASEIRDIMRDTRRDGVEQYSEVILIESGSCSGPQINIRGHRRPAYSIFCNGMSLGSLMPNGSVTVAPAFDAKCYTAPSTIITYDEIERFHLLDMGAGLNVYNSNGVQISVDYIKDRIDCKADLVARELRCQVVISPDSEQISVEQSIQHKFVFSDFNFMVGRQMKVVDSINNGFVLSGDEICQNLSVQWAPSCKYQGGHDIVVKSSEYTGSDNRPCRDICITVHKRQVENKPLSLTVDVSLKRGSGELYVYIDNYKTHNIIAPNQTSTTINLLQRHAEILNNGGSLDIVVKNYKDKPKYETATITKANFFSGRYTLYMKPLKRSMKVWIMLALCIVVGAAGYATYSLLFGGDDDVVSEASVATQESAFDYYKEDSLEAIIAFHDGEYLSNKGEYTAEQLAHIEAGYLMAKLLVGLNANDKGEHSNKDYKEKGKRDDAINQLLKANTGRDDLKAIFDILGSDAPVTGTIRNERFSSDSIKEWLSFCEEVKSEFEGESYCSDDKSVDSGKSNSGTTTNSGKCEITIGGKKYSYDPNDVKSGEDIRKLIMNPTTSFSIIIEIDNHQKNDNNFKQWCKTRQMSSLLQAYVFVIKSIKNKNLDEALTKLGELKGIFKGSTDNRLDEINDKLKKTACDCMETFNGWF